MRNLFAILSLFVVLSFSYSSAIAQDEKATSILKTAKSKLDGMSDFTANFKYTLSGTSTKASKSGKIKYKKGKFRVEMPDQDLFCDQKKMWVFLKKDNEVNVSSYDATEGLDIEQIFKTYQQSAKARLEGEESIHSIACFKVFIAAANAKSDYNQVRLWINKASHYLEKAELTDRRQVKTIYEFTNIKTNNSFPDSDFRFDSAKHPGVKVYDETN